MNSIQLSLFTESSDAVETALDAIMKRRAITPNHNAFVSELGSLLTAKPPGSVIIAAVPNRPAVGQVCASLEQYLDDAAACGVGRGRAALAFLEIPHASNQRMLQRQIAEAYTALPSSKIGHIHAPQFVLDFGSAYTRPNPLQQICGMLRGRTPDYYLVRNAHYLSPHGSSMSDGVNQMRFFIQLANQSGKTHVLFTNACTAGDWLSSEEITNEVTARWLRPYDRHDSNSFLEFQGILKGYENLLPANEEFMLLQHAVAIYDAVWGCTYRLNKWLLDTLVAVRARGNEKVTWDDFCRCAPSKAESEQAGKEFLAIRNTRSSLFPTSTLGDTAGQSGNETTAADQSGSQTPPKNRPPKTKSPLKPGQHTLGRAQVGQDDKVAA